MIDTYVKKGITSFVISSSGNAALAAAMHISKNHSEAKLTILVGEKIPEEKLKALLDLKSNQIHISQVPRPLMELSRLEKEGWQSLRQSTDENALTGYASLADEIVDQESQVSDIFIVTSSGTTAVSLHKRFLELDKNIKIHIVQTPAVHPFIESAHKGTSLAQAVSDVVGHRRSQISEMLIESNGSGIIATDKYIEKAKIILEPHYSNLTPNGLLSVAGLIAHLDFKNSISKSAVCIIGGK